MTRQHLMTASSPTEYLQRIKKVPFWLTADQALKFAGLQICNTAYESTQAVWRVRVADPAVPASPTSASAARLPPTTQSGGPDFRPPLFVSDLYSQR